MYIKRLKTHGGYLHKNIKSRQHHLQIDLICQAQVNH